MTKQGQFLVKSAEVASIILAGGGVISALVLSYFLYHYDWIRDRQFASSTGTVLCHALPAIFAVLLFACLRLKPAHKTTVAILCLALTASVYGLEIFLYLNDARKVGRPEDELVKLAQQFGVDFDIRDEIQVIADLRKKGIEAVRGVILPILERQADGRVQAAIKVKDAEVMPLSGIARRVTVVCREGGQWLTYDSDEYGFHNPPGIWQAGWVDIAALGNSWTHGWCVPSDKNFVALIRQRYPATLNLGMAGEGPLQILAVLKEYLPHFKPKLVLWFYFEGNNLLELQKEKQSRLLMRYLEDDFSQDLVGRQHEIDQALLDFVEMDQARKMNEPWSPNELNELLDITKLGTLRRELGLISGIDTQELKMLSDLQGSTLALFSQILSQAKNQVSAWGGTLYFVYLPNWERYATDNPGVAGQQRIQIFNLVDNFGIPIIDIHPVFQAQSDPLSLFPFRKPWHYNDKGHQLVAEEVLKAIFSSRLHG